MWRHDWHAHGSPSEGLLARRARHLQLEVLAVLTCHPHSLVQVPLPVARARLRGVEGVVLHEVACHVGLFRPPA
eukprot:146751-Alexandrium_andersonii.AAC.2